MNKLDKTSPLMVIFALLIIKMDSAHAIYLQIPVRLGVSKPKQKKVKHFPVHPVIL